MVTVMFHGGVGNAFSDQTVLRGRKYTVENP